MLHLWMGKPPPRDRRMRDMAVEVLHWFKTGEYPFPGRLADQPSRIKSWLDALRVFEARLEQGKAGIASAEPKKPPRPGGATWRR